MRPRALSGAEVVKALRTFGFEVVNLRGSHAKLRRITPDGARQTLTVPMHPSLARGTVTAIFRQASRFIDETALRPLFFS